MSEKYPKTYHLDFSPGATRDDKVIESITKFLYNDIIISEKMDGSNTCMQRDGCFARSHSTAPKHPSFDAFKAFHASLSSRLIDGYQYFGEWNFTRHSIYYFNLPDYFLLFGIRNGKRWLSWAETERTAQALDLTTVPVLFSGRVDSSSDLEDLVTKAAREPSHCGSPEKEGVVVRVAGEFDDADFNTSICKWVRADHIQTDDHWSHQEIIQNKLAARGNRQL